MVSIRKFRDFLVLENNENIGVMVEDKLNEIKNKIEQLFASKDQVSTEGVVKGEKNKIKKFGEDEQPSESFKSLNMEDLDMSSFSQTSKTLKLIYSDDEFRYDVTFKIEYKDVATPEGQELNQEGLDNCYVHFVKYSQEGERLGQHIEEKFPIKDIDEDFFDDMLLKVEEKSSTEPTEDEEEFKIEFEEGTEEDTDEDTEESVEGETTEEPTNQ